MKKQAKIITNNLLKEKRRSIYLLSFLLPLILLITILISKHVFPFGEKCILRTDFYHQYLPFYSLLQDKLKSFGSLFYTYNVGLGTNFISLMAYYLVCPLNILLVLIPKNFVLEFMTLCIILKISLSGFTFSYYLTYKYKKDTFVTVFFALFYALSGYIGAYYWNIMWLDNILIFPLLMLSFERMYNKHSGYMYSLLLGVSLLCNYYIGILTCIFLLFYFIFYSIIRDAKIKEIFFSLIRTAIFSLIGILIAGVLLVPVIMAFKTTASSDIQFPVAAREYFSIIETIGRMFPLVKVENGIDYWPNIYAGTFVFPLFTIYLLSKKVPIKEKIAYSICMIFFFASFSLNFLDFIWHAFKFPNSLPCRQSFVFTFMLLTICMKPLLKIDSIKVRDILIGFSIPILFIILIGKNVINEKVYFYSVYTAIIFIFVYMGIFLMYKNKKYDRNIVLYITIIAISLEAFINMYNTSITTIKRDDYMKRSSEIRAQLSGIPSITDEFYRVEKDELKTKNDGAFLSYPSASIFSSAAYANGTEFYKQFGMEASTNSYSVTGSTPFAESLLSITYKICDKENQNAKDMRLRLISNDEENFLYQNIQTLPFSYVFKNEWIEDYDISSGNPAIVQNNFSRRLGLPLMLKKADTNMDKTTVTFEAKESGNYFAFIRDKGIKEVTVSYANTTKTYDNLNRGYFIKLGYVKENDRFEFRNDTNEDDLLMEVFKFNYDSHKEALNRINDNSDFDMINFDDTHVNYTMDSYIDGRCIVTLPYDSGFDVFVDGKKVETKMAYDFFLSFDILKGYHEININYTPKGIWEGLVSTIIGILLLIGAFIVEKKKIKNGLLK